MTPTCTTPTIDHSCNYRPAPPIVNFCCNRPRFAQDRPLSGFCTAATIRSVFPYCDERHVLAAQIVTIMLQSYADSRKSVETTQTLGGDNVKRISQLLAVLLALSLLAAACGGSDSDSDSTASGSDSESTDNSGDGEDAMPALLHLGDGSLGVVTIEAGEAVQIRSLNAITGDVAFLGVPNQRGVEQA
ncbi:MAG: hypothetical protein ACI88C_002397, partial [Acidimicrobiales bacterium]